MSEFLINLKNSTQSKDFENVKKLLNISDKNEVILEDSNFLKVLLQNEDEKLLSIVAESIAEWAKLEHNRGVLADKELIDLLLNLLNSNEIIVLNVVRALGNICYENETATKMLDKEGLQKILSILYEFDQNKHTVLLAKLSGLLLNIFISNEDLTFVDKNELMDHILLILNGQSNISSDEFCLYSYLLQIIYTVMVEYDEQITQPEKVLKKVIEMFKNSNIPELELICLQILYNASEKDNVRLLLAKSNVCEKIFELVDKYKRLIEDEESRSILKMACDIINNILIEDESMKLLYDGGNGDVYKNSIKWLDSKDIDLLVTAIIAMGNFARNDDNCIAIVKEGISKKLIDLLRKNTAEELDIKLLHGLLSTLKNLTVPSINKSVILKEGLMEAVQPVSEIDNDIVIFKLLGTLRLVTDGQEQAAKDLISQNMFLEKLIKWYNNTYHMGVKREVSRLLVWLIKNCHSWESMLTLLNLEGSINCLVSMFSSEDIIMENEALIALNLLTTASKQSKIKNDVNIENSIDLKFEKQLIDEEIATVIPYIRIFSHSEQMVENLMNLLEKLLESNLILDHFKQNNIFKILKEYSSSLKAQNCLDKTNKIISILSK